MELVASSIGSQLRYMGFGCVFSCLLLIPKIVDCGGDWKRLLVKSNILPDNFLLVICCQNVLKLQRQLHHASEFCSVSIYYLGAALYSSQNVKCLSSVIRKIIL